VGLCLGQPAASDSERDPLRGTLLPLLSEDRDEATKLAEVALRRISRAIRRPICRPLPRQISELPPEVAGCAYPGVSRLLTSKGNFTLFFPSSHTSRDGEDPKTLPLMFSSSDLFEQWFAKWRGEAKPRGAPRAMRAPNPILIRAITVWSRRSKCLCRRLCSIPSAGGCLAAPYSPNKSNTPTSKRTRPKKSPRNFLRHLTTRTTNRYVIPQPIHIALFTELKGEKQTRLRCRRIRITERCRNVVLANARVPPIVGQPELSETGSGSEDEVLGVCRPTEIIRFVLHAPVAGNS